MHQERVVVVGAGLAGSEAAWQLASRGVKVDLFEMRPTKMTEAHKTPYFAELVCSNSLGSTSPDSAPSILKDELERLGSYILLLARQFAVPAGASLAVDREKFSKAVTAGLEKLPQITIHREELTRIPTHGVTIVATGPLTSTALSAELSRYVGTTSLYFYDAISPIVSAESLDPEKMYVANRYGKNGADFLNIPLTKEEYETFVDDLLKGEVMLPHDFEEERYFESCLPIEAMASRGKLTLAYGPMKPIGLNDPRTGKRPFAVIQLRTENAFRTAYNLVGFQTKLKYKEQERIFRKLPGLECAEFLRLGSMHRNTYVDSPRLLKPSLQLHANPALLVAGQLTGTEGYLESAATGLIAGINAGRLVNGEQPLILPRETMLGSLLQTITDPARFPFQPMNVNLGLLPPLDRVIKDRKLRNAAFAERARRSLPLSGEGCRCP